MRWIKLFILAGKDKEYIWKHGQICSTKESSTHNAVETPEIQKMCVKHLVDALEERPRGRDIILFVKFLAESGQKVSNYRKNIFYPICYHILDPCNIL